MKYKIYFSIFILISLMCITPASSEIMQETVYWQNNTAIAENNIFRIEIDHITAGVTYATLTSKTYTGDIDFAIGLNGSEVQIESIELYKPHTVTWDTEQSHIFYYVTGFTPRTSEPLDYGNEYNPQQYVVSHSVFDGYDENNNSIWAPSLSVVAFDTQTNDGTNYTATWHTEYSRIEEYVDLGMSGILDYDYDGKDTWYVTQNRYVEAGQNYQIKITANVPVKFGEHRYKYDFALKPSSESLAEARTNGHLYLIDPWWSSTFDIRREIHINNTLGDSVTDYQLRSVNLSPFNINATSARIVNDTSGLEEPFWNETVDVNDNLEYVWANFSSLPNGSWINSTYYVYYQSTPTANSASDGDATFEFFDDFSVDLSKWTIVNGAPEVANGYLIIDLLERVRTNNPYDRGMLTFARVRNLDILGHKTIERTDTFTWYTTGDRARFYFTTAGNDLYSISMNNGVETAVVRNGAYSTYWYNLEIVPYIGGQSWFWLDGIKFYHTTNIPDAANLNIMFASSDVASHEMHVDYTYVRKFVANEPEPWTVGDAEYYTPAPTPTPIYTPTIMIYPAQYDEMDLSLMLYILLSSGLYALVAFKNNAAVLELSTIYLIFLFVLLLFQTITISVNYIYITLFLLLFQISIAGMTLKTGGNKIG